MVAFPVLETGAVNAAWGFDSLYPYQTSFLYYLSKCVSIPTITDSYGPLSIIGNISGSYPDDAGSSPARSTNYFR